MEELIRALTLLSKYEQPVYPTGCDHDVLHVYVDPANFTQDELKALEEMGFHVNTDVGGQFYSFRYGSA